MESSGWCRPAWWLYGPALAWLVSAGVGLGWNTLARWRETETPIDRVAFARAGVARSDTCRACHPAQHETWYRSFHRSMTQRADGSAVLAPFAGEHLDVLGHRATMDRTADGRPRIRIARLDDDGRPGSIVLEADVELTVGSHRVQQYVARLDRGGGPLERWRLPLAWHVAEARWIHLSGAFLLPQGRDGEAEDYFRHLSRWNDNCIFCHNTEPVPGLTPEGTYATTVGELGIACEACHGPAEAHVRRQRWPLERMAAAIVDAVDPTITPGAELPEHRAVETCGRCHGNRIARDLGDVLAHGERWVPGTPLLARSRPIERDSTLAGSDEPVFADRFWPDGTPRLSAYEYQALLASPCHRDGGLECGDCHTMHGDDPVMQLRSDAGSACVRCHDAAKLSPGHRQGSHPTTTCADCHMPRVTYGLMQGMMSHRITVPEPAADKPDACTQCHVDRSRGWAASSAAVLGFHDRQPPSPHPWETWASRIELDLHGGDPIARALAVDALGQTRAAAPVEWRIRVLLDAYDDEYPAVRWMAWRALRALTADLAEPETHVWLAEPPPYDVVSRTARLERLQARWGRTPLHRFPERIEALQAARDDRAIEIGE